MEASFAKEMKVGIFTGIGVLAFLISIVLLGGDKFIFKSSYHLRVQFSDVQGLSRGSVVSLEGVPVGNVHKLQFLPQTKQIEAVLDIEGMKRPSAITTRDTVSSRRARRVAGNCSNPIG